MSDGPSQTDPYAGAPFAHATPHQPVLGGPPGGRLARPGWGPGQVALGLLTMVGLVFVSSIVAYAAFGSDELDSLGGTAFLQALFALSLAGAAVLVAGTRSEGVPTLRALGFRRPEGKPVVDSLIAFGLYFAAATVISLLLSPQQEDVTRALGVGESTLLSIVAGLLIIVAAPLSEEIFFRGFAFAGLRRGTPFVLAALLANGVWALFHLTGETNWGVVVQLLVFGIALSWLYERTNSIVPCIALHAFNNAIAFSVLTSGT